MAWQPSTATRTGRQPQHAAGHAAHGFTVWNLEYRRVGSQGVEGAATFEDIASGIDALMDIAERFRRKPFAITTRGHSAGGHLAVWAAGRSTRRNKLFSTQAVRLETLHELTKLSPVAVIAETLGYSPITIERHAIDSAATYSQYIATLWKQRNV